MMKKIYKSIIPCLICILAVFLTTASAGVTADEAGKLKTTLTPLGAEKAGNKEGTIPAWDGGYGTVPPGFIKDGKRTDPFSEDKPLYSISMKNMKQYEDKLAEGVKELMKRYPDTFRLDVYQTRRTALAPQWVYDNTFKNATRATLNGYAVENAYGGIPFPMPKSGLEAMWNHLLHWRGTSYLNNYKGYIVSGDGEPSLFMESINDQQMPYFKKDGDLSSYDKVNWVICQRSVGPPIRAGEGLVGLKGDSPDIQKTWTYLVGQRRVRRLPVSCCDTPVPTTGGLVTFDEVEGFNGSDSLEPFDWKIVGKKEIFIPYNSNRTMAPPSKELLTKNHLNPDYVRWELHRVWVIEATIREGRRHVNPKNHYYLDEDTWCVALADRYDANGSIARLIYQLFFSFPDLPASKAVTHGNYDFINGTYLVNYLLNDKPSEFKVMPYYDEKTFTPEALTGESVR